MMRNIRYIINSKYFRNFIITLIVINSIIFGLETSDKIMENYGETLQMIDEIILFIFVIEILLRLLIYRLRFFLSPWNNFDFGIVALALLSSAGIFSALRTLRILRVLRLLSVVPTLRKVVVGLLSAIPGIISVLSIMAIFFYIFAVIGTHLFGDYFPDWFGSLGKTMFTLFQIMTLESWSMSIVRPIMDIYPYSWIFFVLYILVTTFTMLNLFIAIIVNAMHDESNSYNQQKNEDLKKAFSKEIVEMENKIMKKLSEIEVNNKKT